MKSSSMALGLALSGAGLFVVACGGSSSGGGGETTGASSSASGSSSSSSSGAGGEASGVGGAGASGAGGANPTGGGGGMGAAGGGGGAGGGNTAYTTCNECTSDKGAAMNECLAEHMACMEYKTCVSILNCTTNGTAGGPGPCDNSTVKGACCTLQCEAQIPDDAEGIARYRALDACIHCKTCASLCNTATTYCPVFEPGGEKVCN